MKTLKQVYSVWKSMRQRCMNPKDQSFPNYGGRGIYVCSRWNSFKNFVEDMGIPESGMTLDRSNNDKGYEPSNCRWASRKIQNSNKRSNVMVKIGPVSKPLLVWASDLGLNRSTVYTRFSRHNWTAEQSLGLVKKQHGGIGNKNARGGTA